MVEDLSFGFLLRPPSFHRPKLGVGAPLAIGPNWGLVAEQKLCSWVLSRQIGGASTHTVCCVVTHGEARVLLRIALAPSMYYNWRTLSD